MNELRPVLRTGLLQRRRVVECEEPCSDRPLTTTRLKSIASPFGDIGRVEALGMNSRRTRSTTPSSRDVVVESLVERYYSIRGNLTQKRCGLPSVCVNYDDIRRISEGGTAAQKSLLRNNFKRFSTREEAQEWSETEVASIFPKKWGDFTPAVKMLAIVTCVLVFLYFVRDLVGFFEERRGCTREQFSFLCDMATDAKKFVKDQQWLIVNAIGKTVAIWFYKLSEYTVNNMFA